MVSVKLQYRQPRARLWAYGPLPSVAFPTARRQTVWLPGRPAALVPAQRLLFATGVSANGRPKARGLVALPSSSTRSAEYTVLVASSIVATRSSAGRPASQAARWTSWRAASGRDGPHQPRCMRGSASRRCVSVGAGGREPIVARRSRTPSAEAAAMPPRSQRCDLFTKAQAGSSGRCQGTRVAGKARAGRHEGAACDGHRQVLSPGP